MKLDLGEGESITENGQHLIDGLKSFAVEHDLPAPAVGKLAQWYDAQIKTLQAKLVENDKVVRKATRDTLTQKWAGAFDQRMEVAKAGVRLLPQGLREALKTARTPDGRRVADLPELAEAMLAIGRLSKGTPAPTSDEARLAEITKVMNSDIDRYQREGLSKEYLDLMRKIDARGQTHTPGILTTAEVQEEAELIQLMQTDIYTYNKPWRGTKRSGSDRLLELSRKRAGA